MLGAICKNSMATLDCRWLPLFILLFSRCFSPFISGQILFLSICFLPVILWLMIAPRREQTTTLSRWLTALNSLACLWPLQPVLLLTSAALLFAALLTLSVVIHPRWAAIANTLMLWIFTALISLGILIGVSLDHCFSGTDFRRGEQWWIVIGLLWLLVLAAIPARFLHERLQSSRGSVC